jgi:hypothetical protein
MARRPEAVMMTTQNQNKKAEVLELAGGHTHACMHACMHTYIHTYISVCIYIHTYMYAHPQLTVCLKAC